MKVKNQEITYKTNISDITELEKTPSLIENIVSSINQKVTQKINSLDSVISHSNQTIDGEPAFSKLASKISDDYIEQLKGPTYKLFDTITEAKERETGELRILEERIDARIEELTEEINKLEETKRSQEANQENTDSTAKEIEIYENEIKELKKKKLEVQDTVAHLPAAYNSVNLTFDAKKKSLVFATPNAKGMKKEVIMENGVEVGYVLSGYDEDGNYKVTRMEQREDGSFYHVTYTYDSKDTSAQGLKSKTIEYYNTEYGRYETKQITYNSDGTTTANVTYKNTDGSIVTYEATYNDKNEIVSEKLSKVDAEGNPVQDYKDDTISISPEELERQDSKDVSAVPSDGKGKNESNHGSEDSDSNPDTDDDGNAEDDENKNENENKPSELPPGVKEEDVKDREALEADYELIKSFITKEELTKALEEAKKNGSCKIKGATVSIYGDYVIIELFGKHVYRMEDVLYLLNNS